MSSLEVVCCICGKREKDPFHFGTYVEGLNGFFRNKVSTFLLSDWLNETEHAINLNTCSWRVQEKAGFMKSRWLFFTTDQWIRNGRTSKSQRICRRNLMFVSYVLLRWVFQLERSRSFVPEIGTEE